MKEYIKSVMFTDSINFNFNMWASEMVQHVRMYDSYS